MSFLGAMFKSIEVVDRAALAERTTAEAMERASLAQKQVERVNDVFYDPSDELPSDAVPEIPQSNLRPQKSALQHLKEGNLPAARQAAADAMKDATQFYGDRVVEPTIVPPIKSVVRKAVSTNKLARIKAARGEAMIKAAKGKAMDELTDSAGFYKDQVVDLVYGQPTKDVVAGAQKVAGNVKEGAQRAMTATADSVGNAVSATKRLVKKVAIVGAVSGGVGAGLVGGGYALTKKTLG